MVKVGTQHLRESVAQTEINGILVKDSVNALTKVVVLVYISARSHLYGLDVKLLDFSIMTTRINQEYAHVPKTSCQVILLKSNTN